MLSGDDLGERGRPGGVALMTAAAEIGDIGERGLEGAGVVGVFGLGSVAGFARDMGVAAGGADFGLILMAQDAGILAGVGDRLGANGVEGAGAEVAVLAEVLRNHGGADDHKDAER